MKPAKLTHNNYYHFIMNYNKNRINGIRLGQHFCNFFGITDSELFYSENASDSHCLISKHIGESEDYENSLNNMKNVINKELDT